MLAIIILFLSCSISTLIAQTSEKIPDKALQFKIGGRYLTLSSFEGATISMQKKIADNRAMRLGLSLSSSVSESIHEFPDESNGIDQENRDMQDTQVEANVRVVFYSSNRNGIAGYWGMGPIIGYGHRVYKDDNPKRLSSASVKFGVSVYF